MSNYPRSQWPLWMQAKHAVRFPSLWTTDDLRALWVRIKQAEGKV